MASEVRTERELSLDFLRVTEAAAIAAARRATQSCHHGPEAEGHLRLVGDRRAHAARCQ